MIKLFGGILFCLIYALYYGGGDTVHYYEGVVAMNTVFWKYPMDYFQILFLDGPYGILPKLNTSYIKQPKDQTSDLLE